MDPKELFTKSVEQAAHCITKIRDEQLDNRTPCTEWNLRDLLNHVVYELAWVPDLLRGKTVTEVGDAHEGDLLRSDFISSWQHVADTACVAVKQADTTATVHLSYGDVTAGKYLYEVGGDIVIHTWDIAQSIGCTLQFNENLLQTVYDNLLPRKDEMAASGLFGEALEVPDDASLLEKLLALSGRKA